MKRALLAAAAVFLAAACFDHSTTVQEVFSGSPTSPTGPSGVTPSPTGAVHKVTVGMFGEECPATITPAGIQNTIRVGCGADLTCTPTLADGSDAVAPLGLTAPDSFNLTSGTVFVSLEGVSNPFNLLAHGNAAGTATLVCVVRGTSSATFTLTVIP